MRRALARHPATAALVVASVPLSEQGAQAQSPEQKATAEVAFQKGVKLMEAGELVKACALLEDSQRLDAQMGTEYQLALCYEKSGRLASAWARYRSVVDAARAAKMADRESWAQERAKDLEARMSTVTIVVAPGAASIQGLQVERNGVAVGSALWGEATFVDGGKQRVTARAPGRKDWSTEIEVARERAKARIEIPALPSAATSSPTTATGTAATGTAPAAGAAEPWAEPGGESGQGIGGIVVMSVGLAALATGVIVGVVAKSSYDSSGEEHCTDQGCDQEGVDAADSARAQGNVATALFVAGGAVAVAGLVTWLTAPGADASATPSAALELGLAPTWGGAVMRLGGAW